MMKFLLVCCILSLVFEVKSASEGSFCKTPLGNSAKCISILKCGSLISLLELPKRTSEQLTFLRNSQCGYDNNGPLVCCGPIAIERYSSIADSQAPYQPNPLIPDRTSCGIQAHDRILGGDRADLDEFPWMAIFEYDTNGVKKLKCAGNLINSRYVVTAAHCVAGQLLQTSKARLVNIRLGEWNTSSPYQDCRYINKIAICNNPELNVGIEEVIIYPRYDGNSVINSHDIALVRLASAVPFSDFIAPICLPLPNEESATGHYLIVSGWGKTETARRSEVKLKVSVPLMDKSECMKLFQPGGVYLGKGQICAGAEKGKDSCTGDSGGPLMRTFPNDTSRWYLEGVVSFGNSCGREGWPAVYAKVSQYVAWIHRTVKA